MAIPYAKTKVGAALIAALLATAGGYAFLQQNPNPTLRQVFAACEAGKLNGVACCEDVLRAQMDNMLGTCGMVKPGSSDPFGIRKKEEDEFDAELHKQTLSMEQLKAMNK